VAGGLEDAGQLHDALWLVVNLIEDKEDAHQPPGNGPTNPLRQSSMGGMRAAKAAGGTRLRRAVPTSPVAGRSALERAAPQDIW
jgi:hypothetical protein